MDYCKVSKDLARDLEEKIIDNIIKTLDLFTGLITELVNAREISFQLNKAEKNENEFTDFEEEEDF